MAGSSTYEKVGIAGSGTIAAGLAAAATRVSEVILLARSEGSAERGAQAARELCEKVEGADPGRLRSTVQADDLGRCDLVIEAIVEEAGAKAALLRSVADAAPGADLATTTSSLSIADLAAASGHGERLFGLHVFNPVTKMELIELCFIDGSPEDLRRRARRWCEAIGKTPVEVPDQAGFVVNRLLFPYLFDAVMLVERTGMSAEDVDACMRLGGGHPMGPLALLDMVGIDVAVAIGESLHADSGEPGHRPPGLLVEMVGDGRLGRKSGQGFYSY
ncbi:MAG: 3-hydroxybutyryl-CoA dehydrogenase [Solirubrobacterales bacterium]|nr:3-hydroxybutyryl-CoA dehydrogenase [Solirubrobacterales bacterium]